MIATAVVPLVGDVRSAGRLAASHGLVNGSSAWRRAILSYSGRNSPLADIPLAHSGSVGSTRTTPAVSIKSSIRTFWQCLADVQLKVDCASSMPSPRSNQLHQPLGVNLSNHSARTLCASGICRPANPSSSALRERSAAATLPLACSVIRSDAVAACPFSRVLGSIRTLEQAKDYAKRGLQRYRFRM